MTSRLSTVTRLVRAAGASVVFDGAEGARLRAGPGSPELECGRHALSLLEVFAQPLTVEEAEERLAPRIHGPRDWIDLMNTLLGLYDHGILKASGKTAEPDLSATGYGAASVHVAMLEDRARTEAYRAAIREVVRPGDVVVDLGTGTGVLAVLAAEAGASRVYAVEASGIADLAQEVVTANGLGDRIRLVRGWSTQVELPERADVLVSELIGSDPLDEGILEMTADARRRLLLPGARLVPSRIEIFASPLSVPSAVRQSSTFTPEALDRWQSWYGIDFSPLLRAGRHRAQLRWTPPYEARQWPTVCPPVAMASLDLRSAEGLTKERRVEVEVEAKGRVGGVLVWFEVTLGPTTRLSTNPSSVPESNHWRSPLWVLGEEIAVEPGDRLELGYGYHKGGPRVTCCRKSSD